MENGSAFHSPFDNPQGEYILPVNLFYECALNLQGCLVTLAVLLLTIISSLAARIFVYPDVQKQLWCRGFAESIFISQRDAAALAADVCLYGYRFCRALANFWCLTALRPPVSAFGLHTPPYFCRDFQEAGS